MDRRTFFKTVVAAGGATLFASRAYALKLFPNPGKKKWAVLFGSRYGSARDASIWISEGMGGIADVFDARENPDLSTFEALIVGSGIYMGPSHCCPSLRLRNFGATWSSSPIRLNRCDTLKSVRALHFPALIERYDPLMKHLNQTRAVLVSLCLLLLTRWSAAQSRLLTDTDHTAETNAELTTIPGGTHLLMRLISPLHTTSATPGSGVYLETAFPVVENGHVVIPEHTRVMGTLEDERRPGRVQGRAQMRLRFTQLILPDNREFSIVGNLQSLPGSSKNRTVNREGTIEPVDQIDADVYTVAKTTGLGVLVGSMHHVGIGVGNGALIGAGLGLAKVLFTRGNEISLPAGTRVEMVLQHPLTLQASSRSTLAGVAETANLRPSSNQPNTIRLKDNIPCLRDGVTLRCVDP